MRSAFLVVTLILAQSAFASTLDSYSLPLDGGANTERFTLSATQTKTLYRDEVVDSTCYRTVQSGWDMQCREIPYTYCYGTPGYPPGHRPGNRPGPGPRPGGPGHHPGHGPRPRSIEVAAVQPMATYCETRFRQECFNVPRYVTESYSCRKTISVPYEVFDFDIKTNVAVNTTYPFGTSDLNSSCKVDFALFGASLSLNSACDDYVVVPTKTDRTYNEGSVVVSDVDYKLTAYKTSVLTAPTANGIKSLKLQGQTVVFTTGDLTKNPNFSLKLFVERRKLLKSDVVFINRNLSPAEYTFEKTGENSGIVKINLSKLFGGINSKRKHVISVNLNALTDIKGTITPSDKIPARSASASITVND